MVQVLLVDDEQGIRISLSKILMRTGYDVATASNAREALEQLEKQDFDVVVSDIIMPQMSGLELLQEVRATRPLLPVILLTGGPSLKSAAQSLRMGAFDYLTKPVSRIAFCRTIAAAADMKKLREENLRYQQNLEEIIKERSAALAVSEQLARSVIEASQDAIIAINNKGMITIFNPAAETMFGYEARSMMGQPVDCLIPEDYRDQHCQYMQQFFVDGSPRRAIDKTLELQAIRSDGSVFPIEMTLAEGHCAEQKIIIGFLRDISKRKQVEHERNKLELEFQQSKKLESLGRLTGGVAHDFNNLLSPILAYTEIMLFDTSEQHPYHSYLKVMQTATERARDLTQKLLAFSRRQVLEVKQIELNEVVRGFAKILRRTIREDIELQWQLASEELHLQGDIMQIEQILMNLLVNAQDAMPSGGKIAIRTEHVKLGANKSASNLEPQILMSVEDTGAGMAPETLERLYEPFFTTKGKGKGTGLGMATVYGIVKQHGGNIAVNSEPGCGTTVKIYFPSLEDLHDAHADEQQSPANNRPGGTETILVVEDDQEVRNMVRNVLQQNGYQVLYVGNPSECLQFVTGYQAPIHLLVTDVIMPQMSGNELYERLRCLFPQIKVLYMSGYSHDITLHHGVSEAKGHFIKKPFSIYKFLEMVRTTLDLA